MFINSATTSAFNRSIDNFLASKNIINMSSSPKSVGGTVREGTRIVLREITASLHNSPPMQSPRRKVFYLHFLRNFGSPVLFTLTQTFFSKYILFIYVRYIPTIDHKQIKYFHRMHLHILYCFFVQFNARFSTLRFLHGTHLPCKETQLCVLFLRTIIRSQAEQDNEL